MDIIECQHCHTRVLPTKDFVCPSCRKSTLEPAPHKQRDSSKAHQYTMMAMAMRACVGILGSLHGLAAVVLFGLSALMDGRSDPVAVWSIVPILIADVMSTFSVISGAIAEEKATGFLLTAAGANVVAVAAFCVIPLMQADGEYAEGLGMLIASGIIVPVLGPLLVNAFILFGITFVQRSAGSN